MWKEKEKDQVLSLDPGCSKDKQSVATERVSGTGCVGWKPSEESVSKRREWSVGPHGAGDP